MAVRYWNLFREPPTGRDRKRILNRAVTCPLCGNPLSADRALYRAYTGHMDHEHIAAHPACADRHMQQLTDSLTNGINRLLRRLA
jgi:hypothetical protein